MIQGSCHCGQVEFSISALPEKLVDCNCSVCRRLGALWGHVEIGQVTITPGPEATLAYAYGDRNLAFHSCKTCGCTTHWENLKPQEGSQMAVNFRMCSPEDIEKFRIRKFDGANSWQFLD